MRLAWGSTLISGLGLYEMEGGVPASAVCAVAFLPTFNGRFTGITAEAHETVPFPPHGVDSCTLLPFAPAAQRRANWRLQITLRVCVWLCLCVRLGTGWQPSPHPALCDRLQAHYHPVKDRQ